MIYLVMVLLMQFMTTVNLQNVFFGFLSFIPFVAAIGGFEYAYQKKASSATEKTKNFRRKSAAKRYATDILATHKLRAMAVASKVEYRSWLFITVMPF